MASEPIERAAQMFPVLTPAQIERIAGVGIVRDVRAGELLFDAGDQNIGFFVVLDGAICIQLVHRALQEL